MEETITESKKEYFSAYRRKIYNEQPEKLKAKNKAYYYKYKFNASNDDMAKYDIYLPSILKIKNELNKLKEVKPEFVKEILNLYK